MSTPAEAVEADTAGTAGVPGLRRGVRLVHDPVRGAPALLYPEGVLLLNETAAAVLRECDGVRDIDAIAARLNDRYDGVSAEDVADLLADLHRRRLIGWGAAGQPVAAPVVPELPPAAQPRAPTPLGLLAELTYRCPLHCTYCANPINLAGYRDELDTAAWCRVLDEARALGVLQVHFSGGEPLLRRDLADLVRHAHGLGMYVNLVTSGIPLAAGALDELAGAGLDHLQLSIQDARPAEADAVAGIPAHARKLAVAEQARRLGLTLTANAVLHRGNVDRLVDITALAAAMGADRVELAHTQYYGWALRNRAALMPSAEQVAHARRDAVLARQRYGDRLEIVHVLADYHTGAAKPCMDGWGSRQLVVAPNGDVLPCLAAAQLPGLVPVNATHTPLRDIWYDSSAFNRFRGTDWLPEPCQSCALREVDFGGCRCQAYQLTGDPGATDPACHLSPHHDRLVALSAADPAAVAVPRRMR
jgi:pyrroloquinoline quinone biosynthesis protein E